ncbi:MAG TPA: zf-HC2 domain-containing protein [Candidatus Angelobacter sp.]|nr:zf-HC2 domain-containing protein [Candidatus Angelobacter sp.]
MNAKMIEHEQAIKAMMAERYLLGELTENERDAYEAHFFECQVCFDQVKAGTEFVSYLKQIGAEEPVVVTPRPVGLMTRLLAGLRQPIAACAVAACVLAVGSNVYLYRELSHKKGPAIERRYVLTGIAHGGQSVKLIEVPPSSILDLDVDYTTSGEFTEYGARILSESGLIESSLSIPMDQADGMAKIAVPADSLKAGKYSIIVWGRTDDGNESEIGRGAFELHFSK